MVEAPTELLSEDSALRARTFDEIQAFGVRRLRVVLYWHSVAPVADDPGVPRFDETDPNAYPGFARYDRLVAEARARGMRILLTVSGPVPRWATRDRDDTVTRPSATRFGGFMRAVIRRYGDAVDDWSIWNEPNHPDFLRPQYSRSHRPRVARHLPPARLRRRPRLPRRRRPRGPDARRRDGAAGDAQGRRPAHGRVRAFSQYLMRDDREREGADRFGGFQSGLRTVGGEAKPAYDGFRLPLVALRGRTRTTLWGLVRPARARTSVVVEYRDRGSSRWRRLKRDRANTRGYWTTTTRLVRSRRYRIRWTPTGGAPGTGAAAR